MKKIGKNILVILSVIIIFAASATLGNIAESIFTNYYLQLISNAVVYIGATILLGGFFSKKVLKMDLDEIGLSFKNLRWKWIVVAVALPVCVLLFYVLFTSGTVVKNEERNLFDTILFAVIGVGLPAGIVEEFIFRGIVFRYMKKTLGTIAAIVVPAVLFASLHIMNMQQFDILDLILLILAGSSVAIMFTLIALTSESIWPGALVHAVWNVLIIGSIFGVGDIVNGSENNAVWQYRLTSTSKLLTGGNFGIEAALPAIAGYIIVIILCYLQLDKTKRKSEVA